MLLATAWILFHQLGPSYVPVANDTRVSCPQLQSVLAFYIYSMQRYTLWDVQDTRKFQTRANL